MPWPIPTAKTVAERIAGVMETAIQRVRPLVDPVALSRSVRSARGMLSIIGRAVAKELRQIHDHVAWWGRQYFVDTAEDEFVFRHASIWGVEQRPATTARGPVLIEGIAGTIVPAGLEFAADGVLYTLDAPTDIGVDGTAVAAVTAVAAGLNGNLETGIRLRVVTPFPDISRVTVAGDGIAGGAAEETPAEVAAATIARIRQPPHGGAGFDYPTWLRSEFSVRAVKVHTDWIGRGSVGVIVAMREGLFGRAPTASEQADMLTYLGAPGSSVGVRPVTAHVVIVPARMHDVRISIRLRPDNLATRAAVTEAFERFVATIGDEDDEQNDSPIGALIEPSRISEALSAAAGEYAHDLVAPAAPYRLGQDEYPRPGGIDWLGPLS